MSPQHSYMLSVVRDLKHFVPALMVKSIRKWPNDYRKRLSEMKRKGLVKVIGKQDRFAVWSVTKEGKKIK